MAVVVLMTLCPPATGAREPGGTFTRDTEPGTEAYPTRDYMVYVPDSAPPGSRALVVYLHGCTQTAIDAAVGTRWNELAATEGFVVAYPEQPESANGALCWNWFLPEHQTRGSGEPATIAAITRSVMADHAIDPARVYILGASAGADMATTLAATHPDLYAALGAFAGCPYATCGDVTGALAHSAMGPHARPMPAIVVQGSADPLNNLAMGQALATQWAGTNDLADDGSANASIALDPVATTHHGLDPSLADGAGTVGDTCVRNGQFPCAGAVLGLATYPYSIARYRDASGCSVVESWAVHGLSHDYPGGNPEGSFTDPIGPDMTAAAWDFFGRHRLGDLPCGTNPR